MDLGGQTVAKWESRALRGCRLVGQGISPATGASPVGRGPLVPAGRRPPGWTSCDPGPPKAEASSPVAGQVSTKPGRADQLRPRRPRLAPGPRLARPSWRALGWARLSLRQDPAQKPPRPPPGSRPCLASALGSQEAAWALCPPLTRRWHQQSLLLLFL